MLFSHFDFLLGLSRCATVFPLFFSYSFVCFVCSFACFVFPFLFSSGVFLVSRCSRYGALSHFSLCPAYVLLDLTSHGTDFLFPLFCSVLLSSSSLPFFFSLLLFYSGGVFLFPCVFVHTGFFHYGCHFMAPVLISLFFFTHHSLQISHGVMKTLLPCFDHVSRCS